MIDAYNILKQINSREFIKDEEKEAFQKKLKRYADRRKHKLVVVYDGGPYDWTHKETAGLMKIVYSGRHESADIFIMHYLEQHESKDLLLVSSDHELGLYASSLGIPSINALDFMDIINDILKEQSRSKHTDEIIAESEELDTLMEEASYSIVPKDEDMIPYTHKPSFRASKIERKLWQKLKKL